MPGQWVLDDDQSLYFLDSEDESDTPVTSRPPVQSLPAKHERIPVPIHFPDLRANARRLPSRRKRKKATSPESSASPPYLDLGSAHCSSSSSSSSSTWTPQSHRDASEDSAHRAAAVREPTDVALARFTHSATLLDQTFVHPLSGLTLAMGYNTSLPKSRFDTYITALRQLIRCSTEKCGINNDLQRAISAEGVLWVVREAWPAAEGYWNFTATFRGFLHAELWRNFPCERSYKQLPPAYRPTRAQLTIPHSPMIDWMPWPDVRDLAIRFQDQIDVDNLFRMAIHNLVAHRRKSFTKRRKKALFNFGDEAEARMHTELNPDGESDVLRDDNTSFRVWDLVCLEKDNSNPLSCEPGLYKKPIVRSPWVQALLLAYDLEYDEFDTQKLDDGFFEAYPCLYADTAASGWKVKSFPGVGQVDVGRPVELTRQAVFRMKSKIESLVGAEIEI